MTERLAALLHDVSCLGERLYCIGRGVGRCGDLASALAAQGVRVGDDVGGPERLTLTLILNETVAPLPGALDRIGGLASAALATLDHAAPPADAGGLRAALEATYPLPEDAPVGPSRGPYAAGWGDRGQALLAAQPAPPAAGCRHCIQQGHTTEWHEAHYPVTDR